MASKSTLIIAMDDNLTRMAAWARNGLTDKQIAINLGVSQATLIKAKKDPEYGERIKAALKKGKDIADIEVENSLFKSANGYEYEETKEEYEMGILTKRTVTKKFVPPSVPAQIFWLKNRKPTEWRDRREIDNTVALEKLDEVLGQITGCE